MQLFNHNHLRDFVEKIFHAAGSIEKEPRLISDQLVDANLVGHDSHGVGLVRFYIDWMNKGIIRPNMHIKVLKNKGPFLVVDGQNGYGQVIAQEAMELALEQADKHGVVILALRNSHHIGRVGAWAQMAAEAGLLSIHFANVVEDYPPVAPYGGVEPRFGTNPFCCALPATKNTPSTILDMATSKIALGKVLMASSKKEQVPEGCLIDKYGRPTTDPSALFPVFSGALLPFGDHKGYGLAMMCEMLAGAVAGGPTIQPGNARTEATFNNMFAILINPNELSEQEYFESELDAFIEYIKSTHINDAEKPVLIPGDPERITMENRISQGIPLDEVTWDKLCTTAISVGVKQEDIPGFNR